MKIKILNWYKYQPRKDIVQSSWFRMQNNIFDNVGIYMMNAEERCLFFYFCCLASKAGKDEFEIKEDQISTLKVCSSDKISTGIQKMEQYGMILQTSRDVTSRVHNKTIQDNTRQDKQDNLVTSTFVDAPACPKIAFNWNTKRLENIKQEHRDKWKAAFPSVNIDQQLAKIESWHIAKPVKAKRRKNKERLIHNWFSLEQENAGRREYNPYSGNVDSLKKRLQEVENDNTR